MDEYGQRRKNIYFWMAISAVASIVLLVAESSKIAPDYVDLSQNVGLSIFCSILASGIYALLQTSSESDARRRELEEIQGIKQELKAVNEKLKLREDLYDSGIVSIRKKSYYEDEGQFWRDIIESTSDK